MERGLHRYEKSKAPRAQKSAKYLLTQLRKDNETLMWLYQEKAEENKALEYKATHDNLTGLLNKEAMEKRIARRIETAKETDAIGLFFIDLTNFKKINDEKGHQVGDEVLCDVASHINGVVRQEDSTAHYVSRHGGDEFVVLLEDLHSRPKDASPLDQQGERRKGIDYLSPQERINNIYNRLATSFKEFRSSPVSNSSEISLADMGFDVSIGSTLWQPGISAEQLLYQAEQDMYAHKIIQHDTGGSYR